MNRIIRINSLDQARHELKKIGVSSRGIEVMAPKALPMIVKLCWVRVGAANIIKQEMLSIGGDAAVARGVVEGSEKISDVIILGNYAKIVKLIKKLQNQNIFGLDKIRLDLEKLLNTLSTDIPGRIVCRDKTILLDRTRIMGILNVTPDSFSDGGKYIIRDQAIVRAREMIEEGVDVIDIGGESTRPGSEGVSVKQELERVIPVLTEIRKITDIPISIDTCKESVARIALESGADMVNDVSGLRFDKKMIHLLREKKGIPVVIMHMQGSPRTMQETPYYEDPVQEILDFFRERINFCYKHGIEHNRIIIDPGIGFGKRQQDNMMILKKIGEFKCLGVPVLLGASRKSFIGRIFASEAQDRLEGSLAAAALAFYSKIDLVRVHDVKSHHRFFATLNAIERSYEFFNS